MSWNQIAENWNGQVTKLYNWAIKRLASPADKNDVKAAQTDCQLPLVKPRRYAGQETVYQLPLVEPCKYAGQETVYQLPLVEPCKYAGEE
jgi:hypothetical protein